MKAVENFLANAERAHASRVWAYYSTRANSLGKKSIEQLEASIANLTTKASWFLAVAAAKNADCKQLGLSSKADLLKAVGEIIRARGWKPTTEKSLAKVLTRFRHTATDQELGRALNTLLSKHGNHNANRKLTLEQQGMILDLFLQNRKLKTTWKRFNQQLEKRIEVGLWSDQAPVSIQIIRRVVKDFSSPVLLIPEKAPPS